MELSSCKKFYLVAFDLMGGSTSLGNQTAYDYCISTHIVAPSAAQTHTMNTHNLTSSVSYLADRWGWWLGLHGGVSSGGGGGG